MNGNENTKSYYQRSEIPDDLIEFFEEITPPATPCIVLDPFAGSGTTGVVSRRHGRHFIGLDLSFAYLRDQAKERLGLAALEAFENGAAVHDPNDYSDLFKVAS